MYTGEAGSQKMEYQRDISGNYLVLREYADDYRVHMLENNRIPGLLGISLYEDDGRQDIRYEIGSRESLRQLLDARALTGESVSRIIRDVIRTVRELGAYMLDKEDLMLDPDYIYLDEHRSAMLCYVPGNTCGMRAGLSELLRRMLTAIDNNDHDSVVLTYSLYQESLRENYVIDDLMKIIQAAERRSQELTTEEISYSRAMEQEPMSALKVAESEPEPGEFAPSLRERLIGGMTSGKRLFRGRK